MHAAQNIPVADVIATSLSDHDMVACIRNINHQSYKPKMIKCRDYKNYDLTRLCKDMNNIDWQPLYEIPDVNKALNYLNSTLGAIFGKYAPLIEKRVKGRKCEWLTCDLKCLLRERDRLLRKARRTKDPVDWGAYKTLRNKFTNDVGHAKEKYYRDLLNEKSGDPKKFWDCIKSIFPNKSTKTTLSSLSRDDAKACANSYSSYFKNVIRTQKTKAFPVVDFAWRFIKPPPAKTDKRFIFKCVSRVQIERDLRSLQCTKAYWY